MTVHTVGSGPRSTFKTLTGWFGFFALTFLILNLPDHPDAVSLAAFLSFPVEIVILAALLLATGRRTGQFLRALIVVLAGAILFLKLADIGTQAAFQRPFNPYLDGKMLLDGWNLASGTLGTAKTAAAVAVTLLVFVLVLMVYARCLRVVSRTPWPTRGIMALIAVLLSALGVAAIGTGKITSALTAEAGQYLWNRSVLVAHSVRDMATFEAELTGVGEHVPLQQPFEAIRGRDVVLIFVESYGQSAIEGAAYAPLIEPRLKTIEQELGSHGFSSTSRWITSPTVAGISWLAHGTLLSGLWIDSQARYDRLMMSQRASLNRLFSQAGWDSVAVMPAITMDWPEAAYFGYSQVFAARNLGYAGKPFNWVTMPDQYTLSAFQRLVRYPKPRKPVMAEIALVSSHAPWTPVAQLVDWASVGDGTVFDGQAQSGPSPTEVWANPDSIRRHYIQTIDYSLQTIGSYITTFGEDAVFIVIGDHQPAALVTGPDASRAVPLHVISRDRALIDRFAQEGFTAGMIPHEAPEMRMDRLRDLLMKELSAKD